MGKNKEVSKLLKFVIIICIAFVGFRLGEFIYEHVPPYKENTCLVFPDSPFTVKILKNDIIGEQSDIEVGLLWIKAVGKASFQELRESEAMEVDCE